MDTIEYKNHKIEIMLDESPGSPREWDNLGTMALVHGRYNLPNETPYNDPNDIMNYIAGLDCFYLPVYMYDHSGIVLNTSGFMDMWDSGQAGYIFVEKSKVRSEWSVKRISKKIRDIVFHNLKSEVEIYGHYANGEVYGYKISKDGESLDSCFRFYGYDDCLEQAKAAIDYETKEQ